MVLEQIPSISHFPTISYIKAKLALPRRQLSNLTISKCHELHSVNIILNSFQI